MAIPLFAIGLLAIPAGEVASGAGPITLHVPFLGRLPRYFEPNQGQDPADVRYCSRSGSSTLQLTDVGAAVALPGNRKILLRWIGGSASPRISADHRMPSTTSYFRGHDPSKWRTAIPHFSRVRYEDVYEGVDVEFYGNDRDIEFDFVVQPGSDPHALRLKIEGHDSLSREGDDLLVRTGPEAVRLRKPVAYQEIAGRRTEVAARYRTDFRGIVAFDLGSYDPSVPLVIDPVLMYSSYVGGTGFDPAVAIDLDGQGNIYVTGRTSSTAFGVPAGSSFNAGSRSNANELYVAKLNAAGTALVYLAILGGGGDDIPDDLSVRPAAFPLSSDVYVAGTTTSMDFPATTGAFRSAPSGTPNFSFAFRLNSTGTGLVYSTYLGENGGGTGIAVDHNDRAYVSVNEGATAAVKVVSADGSALIHTYGPHQGLIFNDVAVSHTQCGIDPCPVYVTGDNSKGGFIEPTLGVYQHWVVGGIEGFVLRLYQNGYDFATYVAGSGDDTGTALAVRENFVYVAGKTTSADLFRPNDARPFAHGGDVDGFLLKFPASVYVTGGYETYLGGAGADVINDLRVLANVVYVTGTTSSSNLPVKNAFQSTYGGGSTDAFVAAFETNLTGGASVLYSSYFGGLSADGGTGIAVSGLQEAYFTGSTASPAIPLVSPLQATPQGNGDAFVARVAAPDRPFACSTHGTDTAPMRASGTTELAGDILVVCSYGTAGSPVNATVEISSYFPITSRIVNVASSASEALLFVNEPTPANYVVQPAGLTVPGANIIQGVHAGAKVVFPNVDIRQPGPNGVVMLRISNIRLNAAAPGFIGDVLPIVGVAATGLGAEFSGQTAIVGQLGNPAVLSLRQPDGVSAFNVPTVCSGTNTTENSGTVAHAVIRFEELLGSAFRNRNIGITAGNPNPAAPVIDQDILGLPRRTETGFYHSGFPSTSGLNQAGLAQSGTRLMVRFKDVPEGVRIWVTSSHMHSALVQSGGAATLRGLRTAGDDAGAGTYTPIAPTAGSYSEVAITNKAGIAVWEVAGGDITALEWAGFGIAISVPANSTGKGQIQLEAGLAPVGTTTTPVIASSASTPRFSFPWVVLPLASIDTCAPPPPVRIGTYASGLWQLDVNGNGVFDAGSDRSFLLGWPGAVQFTGDWNGDGKADAGVYSNGYWFLDYDGNGAWDNGVNDRVVAWGWAGVTPLVGDWNGDGRTKIGVYSNGFWFLDWNGDFVWDGGLLDKQVGWGWAGVTPFVGDWNGDGRTKIGAYSNGFWFLDYNGNYLWEPAGADKQVGWGWAGVTPIVGDWNGDGKAKIGVYAGGYWYLDYDGSYSWTYPAADRILEMGWSGTTPVIGDWNGDGKDKAGAFINGFWYLDYNGNGVFEGAGTDRIHAFGMAGDTPVVGRW